MIPKLKSDSIVMEISRYASSVLSLKLLAEQKELYMVILALTIEKAAFTSDIGIV